MNRVLVTGLALGREVGVCDVCNFDFSWILNRPSVLLWTDKILVTETIWDTVSQAAYPRDNEEVAESLRLVFDIGRREKIIEVVKCSDFMTTDLKDDIDEQVEKDRILLARFFPTHVTMGNEEKVPGQIFIDGVEYCAPNLWTIYAAFFLSRVLDAHCLFDNRVLNLCKYKFGLANFPTSADPGITETFQSVFHAYIPNCNIFETVAAIQSILVYLVSKCRYSNIEM